MGDVEYIGLETLLAWLSALGSGGLEMPLPPGILVGKTLKS